MMARWPRAGAAEETGHVSFIKGAAAAAVSMVAAAATGIVFALPGHAGLLGSAAGSTVSAAAPAGARAPGPHHWYHHGHHGHHGGGSRSGSRSGSASGGSGSAGSGSGGSDSGGSGSGGSGSGGSGPGGSGSGGSGSGGPAPATPHKVLGPLNPAFPPHGLVLPTVPTLPTPSGTIGDAGVPCLMGYVWRQAYSGDYVCVTPGQRGQAVADNAAAQSRIQAGGGAYGQYTCQQGYLWRQVVPDDYVCVTPAERAQAAADNAQASNRAALLSLWITDWQPPSQPQQNCSGNVCSITEGGWGGPDIQINGDHFNYGPVVLQIRRDDGSVLWSGLVVAGSNGGFAGGSLAAQTGLGDCSQVPGSTTNDYAIAYDMVSGRWSNQVPVDSDCVSL